MKKIVLFLIMSCLFIPSLAKADVNRKKVQTNYQYKLVCGYYNGSDELTWGSQENIGDFKNEDGTPSNSNRACGETAATKKFTLGDPTKNNLPKDVEMIYDNCNGSTGKQKARVGQSCSNEGKVKTCTVKWIGYCYKDPNAKTTKVKKTTKTKTKSSKTFTLTKTSVNVGEEIQVKKNGSCYDYKVEDENILTYNSEDDSFKALTPGKTYINCYDQKGNYLTRKTIKVKESNYLYTSKDSNLYKSSNKTSDIKSTSKRGSKVKNLKVKINGYCKVKAGNKTGYIECDNLSLEEI